MPILLPPSEAKHPGGRGRPISGRQTAPIEAARQATLAALARLLQDPQEATRALLLPASVAEAALAENLRAPAAPTMPAMRRYAGTVYAGLAVEELSAGAQRLAGRELLIFSGLFGVLRGAEKVPCYRVPAKAVLPGLGVAGSYWRQALGALITPMLGRTGLIVDLRSTDYAAMWQPVPGSGPARRLVAVRVLSRRPNGNYGVISYSSKLAKGRLAGRLLEWAAAGHPARSADEVAAAWTELGGRDAQLRPARVGTAIELFE